MNGQVVEPSQDPPESGGNPRPQEPGPNASTWALAPSFECPQDGI